MASIVTLAQDHSPCVATFSSPHACAYCRCPILSGERWVREKICQPLALDEPCYHRYHADLFSGEDLSCWEKHQMAREIAQPPGPPAYA